jgi:uncharacterized membrane protein YfcA
MTTGLRITAAIVGILAGVLLHYNQPLASLIFTAITVFLLLLSLITHRKDELSKHINNEPPKDPYYHKR